MKLYGSPYDARTTYDKNSPIIAVNQDRLEKLLQWKKPLDRVRIVNKDESGIGEVMGYYKDAENTAKTIKDGWLYTGD